MKDCCAAVKLDPSQVKPLHRLVRCLQDLNWIVAANDALNRLKNTFPDHSNGVAFKNLEKEIQASLAMIQEIALNRQSSVAAVNETDSREPRSGQGEELINGTSKSMFNVNWYHYSLITFTLFYSWRFDALFSRKSLAFEFLGLQCPFLWPL